MGSQYYLIIFTRAQWLTQNIASWSVKILIVKAKILKANKKQYDFLISLKWMCYVYSRFSWQKELFSYHPTQILRMWKNTFFYFKNDNRKCLAQTFTEAISQDSNALLA